MGNICCCFRKLSVSFENLVEDSQAEVDDISSTTNVETRTTTASPICDVTNNTLNYKICGEQSQINAPNEVNNISSRTTREQLLGITISDPTTTTKKLPQIQGITVSDPAATRKKLPQNQEHVNEVKNISSRRTGEQLLGITISDPTATRKKLSQIQGITVSDPATTRKKLLQNQEHVNEVKNISSRRTREQLLGITISDPTITRKKLSQIQGITISDHVEISKKKLPEKTDLEKITRNYIVEKLINANSTFLNIKDFDNGRVYKLETLKSDSREFKYVENLFKKTNRPCFVVKSIKKVNNPYLLIQYELKKMEYEKKEAPVKEMKMFHGTKQCNIESICINNFNWRLKGSSRGHIFGQGVSFTPIANYATHYGDKTYNKVMVLVKVLVGKTCQGENNMYIPPEDYDTSTNGKKVYVKYDDNTFYPEYLIHYCGVDDKLEENKKPKLNFEDDFDDPFPYPSLFDFNYPNPIENFQTQIAMPELPQLGFYQPLNQNRHKPKLSQLGVVHPNAFMPRLPHSRIHQSVNHNMHMPKLPHLSIHRRGP